ncbi:hypothetical protein [Planctomyces sp. SH-PL14]|uniref:hypothetical protein n=1 Tax=Planctomyces sp. SH-PL14 TaxID=1632864 RepID=UPI00078D5C96|nr:hypothetical protein [Planctomyces sp. SH-PL14]AMV20432.1 hypothetical protein VT03_21215 [Planctomyces sp. SH-PL14]
MAEEGTNGSKSVKERALEFLFSQPPTTVLLGAIVTTLLAGGWYALQDIKAMVPAHLMQIQSGYERIEAKQSEQIQLLKEDREAERSWMREVLNARKALENKPFAANQ